MDVKKFEYLVALDEEKNISAAAQKLFISQPSLSQFLTATEHELGIKLFNRLKNELVPTYAGTIYLGYAREIIASFRNANSRLQDIMERTVGELSIGVTQERGSLMLHQVYPPFHEKYPNIKLNIYEENPDTLEEMTLKGKIDIAIVASINPQKDLDYIPLCSNRMIIAVNRHNPVIRQHSLPISDSYDLPEVDIELFRDCSFIQMKKKTKTRLMINDIFSEISYKPTIMFETTSAATSLNMIGVSDAVTLLPSAYISPSDRVVYYRLKNSSSWFITAATRKGTYINTVEKEFIAITKKYLNDTILVK